MQKVASYVVRKRRRVCVWVDPALGGVASDRIKVKIKGAEIHEDANYKRKPLSSAMSVELKRESAEGRTYTPAPPNTHKHTHTHTRRNRYSRALTPSALRTFLHLLLAFPSLHRGPPPSPSSLAPLMAQAAMPSHPRPNCIKLHLQPSRRRICCPCFLPGLYSNRLPSDSRPW
ncbi:hypothetical protein GQ53DRAFT_462080 [Thozetella sp. PMI_491]|nr:hypothetical protein GQ53DRAFT_462080 [Thozetella sp. PMI_491]